MSRSLMAALVGVGLMFNLMQPVAAQSAAAPPLVAQPTTPSVLDQEGWAGMSYRQLAVGALILGGSAVVVSWLTSSAITGITAAVTVGAAYVMYDPEGATSVLSKDDLPTLKDLSVTGKHDDN